MLLKMLLPHFFDYCEIFRIFALEIRCSFDLMQNETEYRTLLVSKSLPV